MHQRLGGQVTVLFYLFWQTSGESALDRDPPMPENDPKADEEHKHLSIDCPGLNRRV